MVENFIDSYLYSFGCVTVFRIYAGYNSSIRVFDLHRPGRDFGQYSTLQRNKEGQAGFFLVYHSQAEKYYYVQQFMQTQKNNLIILQVYYLHLLSPQRILECWLLALTVRLLGSIEKTTWSYSMSYMVKKVALHM